MFFKYTRSLGVDTAARDGRRLEAAAGARRFVQFFTVNTATKDPRRFPALAKNPGVQRPATR